MGTSERLQCCVKCLVLVALVLGAVECGRGGGGRSSGGSRSWGSSRPSSSWSRPSPSYSRPSPSYSHPSPSYSHPSPSYSHPSPASFSYPSYVQTAKRPSPSPSHTVSHPSPAYKPIGFESVKPVGSSSSGSHSGTSGTKPVGPPNYGFNSAATHGTGSSNTGSHGSNPPPIGFKPSVTQGSANTGNTGSHGSNPPPIGFKSPATQGVSGPSAAKPPPYSANPSAPIGPPTNVKSVGNAPPGAPYPIHPPPYTPHNPGIPPPAYNPAHNPAGYGPPPAYNPSYNPGYGHGRYPQQQYHGGGYGYPNQQHYTGSPGGITNVNINNINTNNHHYGGGYGGYGTGFGYHGYPSYHYSSGDTGSGTLGFFLGYSLAKITTPTYHYNPGFYSGYTPRYDHYEVHHYYHNRNSVPAQSTIEPNAIVGCIGDSGTICPTGTTSLCTNNGAILCVASATSTVPCSDQKQGNCVKTVIPCVNGTGADCELGTNKTVTIPCISSAKVTGNITYVNNTIIVNNTTIINNNFNGTTNGTSSATNSSTLMTESLVHNGTIPQVHLADSALAALNNITGNGTVSSKTELPTTLPPDSSRTRREAPALPVNEFCVTILALPAERKPTEQETVLSKGTSIFSRFLVRALGVN